MKISINLKLIVAILFLVLVVSCSKDDCEYIEDDCVESCDVFEDFEDESLNTPGNWLGILVDGLSVNNALGSQALVAIDGAGGSWAYNTVDFRGNLTDKGCALRYDVLFEPGAFNSATTDNSLSIFTGPDPVAFTTRAVFVLYPSAAINSGTVTTIEVPLELATGTTLPSNSFGEWILSATTAPYTAANINTFNTLIQNVSGAGFFLDEGSNPSEIWTYDNFCFKQCCPE